MNDKDILANAPEDATHYDQHEYMIHTHDGKWEYWSKAVGWEETTPEGETRSLADIKRIVELDREKAQYIPVLAWIARECSQVDGDMLHRFKSYLACLLYTSPSPRDVEESRMPSSA